MTGRRFPNAARPVGARRAVPAVVGDPVRTARRAPTVALVIVALWAAAGQAAEHAWPLLEAHRLRGDEWTTFVPAWAQPPKLDGQLGEWRMDQDAIALDGRFVPDRGWAAPAPQSDADLSARVKLSWDSERLYLAAIVRDDQPTPSPANGAWGSPFGCDSLVLTVYPPRWLTGGTRSAGFSPLEVMLGLSHYAAGGAARPLQPGCGYVVADTRDGYTIEAVLSFASLGWTPASSGDRFGFGLILVDVDPGKPGGQVFDQYGWNYGPGSAAGTGEARLMGGEPASGELIPEHAALAPGAPLRYVGTVDARARATLQAIEIVPVGGGAAAARWVLARAFPTAGRYRLAGQLPLPSLPPGRYDLRLVWKPER